MDGLGPGVGWSVDWRVPVVIITALRNTNLIEPDRRKCIRKRFCPSLRAQHSTVPVGKGIMVIR